MAGPCKSPFAGRRKTSGGLSTRFAVFIPIYVLPLHGFAERRREASKLIMARLALIMVIMMVLLSLALNIALRRNPLPKQGFGADIPHAGGYNLRFASGFGLELLGEGFPPLDQVGFVGHDHVRAGDMVLKQLGERHLVVQGVIHPSLGFHGAMIMSELPV